MLSEIFRHLHYFLPRLLGFGLILGGFFGMLTYPIFGGLIGAPWGLVGGLLVSLLVSIFIPIYERRFPEEDEAKHQTQMSLAAGVVTTIIMAIPLLVLFAPIAGLTVAYLVRGYTDSQEYTGEKRKSDSQDPYQRRKGVFSKVASASLDKGKWVVLLGTIASTLITIFSGIWGTYLIRSVYDVAAMFLFGIGALAYGITLSLPIVAINGLFVSMMNRLYFKDMPKEQYKPRIIAMLSLLTLFTSAVVTFGIGAPFAAVAAGFAAAKYADWYFEDEEKPKRQARLEDGLEEEEELLDDADEVTSEKSKVKS
jgi:hypothetical protein